MNCGALVISKADHNCQVDSGSGWRLRYVFAFYIDTTNMNFSFAQITKQTSVISLLFFIPLSGMAGELPEVPALPQAEYITPDKMTREDHIMIAEYTDNYNGCLQDTSIEQMNTQEDPRHVVDYAMKHCAGILEELDQKMIEKNFEPNFRQGYIRRISNQAANGMLRLVMMAMANRSAAQTEPAPESAPQ